MSISLAGQFPSRSAHQVGALAVAAGALLLWAGHKRGSMLLTAAGAGFLALMLYAAY
ncbi:MULTISPECIES: hypothetical protein [unclassified Streptomyces]|uniref:hypothetical protein n=1 Tax=unclassified Streptomyces TaxID=2593676 RepID=UPI002E78D91B|nr:MULTISPECIES: hypothetical protein [unclassified Streptomyces]MEE1759467.1 hypothetical protein [Streptomyces sp. SP18BB07]MEE1833373.1 hypothetical protein [Streptomyces sp. SP17KL33]